MAQRLTTEKFMEKARKVHGDKYDYSSSEYINTRSKITIICPEHGAFKQKTSSHLEGRNCPKCHLKNMTLSNDEFIKRANKKHLDRYDYSKVDYVNTRSKVTIMCPEHGEFRQIPHAHLNGQGCPKCFGNGKYLIASFRDKSIVIHGDKYDYSEAEYRGAHSKLTIICPEHGKFEQTPNGHLRGQGCPQCGRQRTIRSHFLDTNEFIRRASKIHDNKYEYSKVNYNNSRDKVTIICPEHGEFIQIPNDHLCGHGCPFCVSAISSGHEEVIDYLKSIVSMDILVNDRSAISPYELDIYIPEKRFAIEYNGLYYHSFDRLETTEDRRKHKSKCELCESKNIRLIQINEDEWMRKGDIVRSVLRSKLGLSSRIYARKCLIKEIDAPKHRSFMNKYHLQGHKGASVRLGLFHEEDLVSVMSFNKHPKYGWEITRFANKLGINVVGGASKLFKYFIVNHGPNQILTFADRRYSDGNLYKKLGFELIGFTKPNYFYIKNKKIFSRQQFQKHKIKDKVKVFNPDLTEAENMFNNGFRRLWDAGHCKFLYK